MKVILASASARRKELLRGIFKDFEVLPQHVAEISDYRRPHLIVQDLAKIKLGSLDKTYLDCLIISADTIVYKDGKLYGKPKDEAQAKSYLDELNGAVHYVYTGVAIYYKGVTTTFYDKSSVKFKLLSDGQILDYIASGSPMDKAGAYGIQDSAVVESYSGSYTNIVGLPMEKLRERLDFVQDV